MDFFNLKFNETAMKHLPLFFLLAHCALFNNTQAATIYDIQDGVSVYASSVTGHSGKYLDQTFAGNLNSPINKKSLSSAVTGSDVKKYAWTADYHMPTGPDNAYIDLSFATSIYNGDGVDLVLFFAGNGTRFKDGHIEPFLFSIEVGGTALNNSAPMGVTTTTTAYNENDGVAGNEFYSSYAMIDLELSGFDQTTPLGDIRIYLGDSSMPALAALGAYHVTAVPLPSGVALFTSGLALLALFRRKSRR